MLSWVSRTKVKCVCGNDQIKLQIAAFILSELRQSFKSNVFSCKLLKLFESWVILHAFMLSLIFIKLMFSKNLSGVP